jgi:photosystem II stability/assembly factor-like uncharacterized protein
MVSRWWVKAPVVGLVLLAAAVPETASGKGAETYPAAILQGLSWREVGPYRGGRVAAVEGIPQERETYYFGATGGGVWKTTDGGATWKNVSDGAFGGSIGAVAVSAWDPNVVYVGTGEVTVRGNVSAGDGMWKSTDAGKTWKHVGLDDSRHITRIRVHPTNPDLVYAAVLGHLWGPSEMRGVYRSSDGGATWQRVLFVNNEVGAVDLAMDPANPRILYATTWRVKRTPWELSSGGEGSGLWRSTDGGDTWKELTDKPGMPKPPIGIIGIAVSPSNHDNLYAIVEAEEGGVFRSRDGGEHWRRVNGDRDLRQRAWYYSRIIADPKDEETVWVPNVRLHRSRDGGKTFEAVHAPHGDDHDLWIDPDDPRRMVEGNDGGACVTTDGGESWSTLDNQPTAQIYRVATDNHFPYRIYGAQQDNTALRILSRSDGRGIGERDWEPTAGGESGYVVPDPLNDDVVYGGSYGGLLVRLNHRTGEMRDLNIWPDNPMGWGAAELRYRFQWNFPIFFSPDDPKTLYAAAQMLFETRDGGQSWRQISPDLTRNDKSKQGPSGGPITKDNTSVEYYDTIFAAAESPVRAGVLWAGSDDGLVHVSRDGGASWSDVTPKGMPEWIQVNAIDPSPFDAAGAYVAATMYKLDDDRPYLYRTDDYGATWTKVTEGIPAEAFTRVVRADPVRRGLLFAGTERGAYVSFDDGAHWQSLQLDLPEVPVTDLAVKGDELVAATQGRGFWVLDGLAVLRQAQPGDAAAALHLYQPATATRMRGSGGPAKGMGENPPNGVVLYYVLKEAAAKDASLKLEILAGDGSVIRSFPDTEPEGGGEEEEGFGPPHPPATLTARAGLNRFVWDMRAEGAARFPGMVLWAGSTRGPKVAPGRYQARLTVGKAVASTAFEIAADPRSSAPKADLQAQYDFLVEVRDTLSRVDRGVADIRKVKGYLDEMVKRLAGEDQREVVDAAQALEKKLTGIEEALYQTKNRSPEDPLNFPIRLNNKLASLASSVAIGDDRPTDQAVAVKRELTDEATRQLDALDAIWKSDLPAFNRLVRSHDIPAVAPPAAGAQ